MGLHGGHNAEESDGYSQAWLLLPANDIPTGYATVGSFYDEFAQEFKTKWGQGWSRRIRGLPVPE
jgi:bilirubin oxidase